MTTKQPEALRMADAIDPFVRQSAPDHLTSKVAADELRRLYWEALRVREHRDQMCAEVTRLHAENEVHKNTGAQLAQMIGRDEALLRQAREALQAINKENLWWGKTGDAITALRARLGETK